MAILTLWVEATTEEDRSELHFGEGSISAIDVLFLTIWECYDIVFISWIGRLDFDP